MQGFADRALNEARLSLEELQGTDHQLQLCPILYHGICRIATMTGDFATADREIARLIAVATGLNAHLWKIAGHFLKGKLLVSSLHCGDERPRRAVWKLSTDDGPE
jgi:hypothetical protein